MRGELRHRSVGEAHFNPTRFLEPEASDVLHIGTRSRNRDFTSSGGADLPDGMIGGLGDT